MTTMHPTASTEASSGAERSRSCGYDAQSSNDGTDKLEGLTALMETCCSAQTRDDQLRALHELDAHLQRTLKLELESKSGLELEDGAQVGEGASTHGTIRPLPSAERQGIVRSLFEAVTVQGMDDELNQVCKEILDGLGIIPCVTASIICLNHVSSLNQKEDGGIKHKGKQGDAIATTNLLRNSLSTIYRMLCTSGRRRKQAQQFQDVSNSEANSALSAARHTSTSSDQIELDSLVHTGILLLPRIISNACLAGKLAVPTWSTGNRFFPRIVRCGLERVYHLERGDKWISRKNNSSRRSCSEAAFAEAFLKTLLVQLIRTHRCDHAISGTMSFVASLEHIHTSDQPCEAFLLANLNKMIPSISPRETATFVRSFVQYSITTTCISYQRESCNQIAKHVLKESADQQSAFLRLMAFHSSSIPSDDAQDRDLCAQVMNLLFTISGSQRTKANSTHGPAISGSDDNSDNTSDDSDDEYEGISHSSGINATGNAVDSSTQSADPLFQRHLTTLLETWSTSMFVQQTDLRMQQHVTRLILIGLKLLQQINHKITECVLHGTTHRLESAVSSVRRDGIRAAILLSGHLGKPIQFEEVSQNSDVELLFISRIGSMQSDERREEPLQRSLQESKPMPSEARQKAAAEEEPPVTRKSSQRTKPAKKSGLSLLDPDAVVESDDEDDDLNNEHATTSHTITPTIPDGRSNSFTNINDETSARDDADGDEESIWSDDPGLVPYDIEDDEEDLLEVARPLYLEKCLEYLRASEKDETASSQHRMALQELPRLIRSQPLNLPDIATSLAMQLLRMQNMYDMDNFTDMLHSNLVALTTQTPLIVGNRLIDELFEDNMSLSDRLNILSALQASAAELSVGGTLSLQADEAAPRNAQNQHSLTSSTSSSFQVAKLESQTRRKRSRTATTTTATASGQSNKLGPVAPIWFYSIVSKFMKSTKSSVVPSSTPSSAPSPPTPPHLPAAEHNEAMWTGPSGSRLLANIFVTLGRVVEGSGYAPGTNVMAWDLLELAWPFRDAEVADVRMGVLMACATAIVRLPQDKLYQILAAGLENGSFARQLADIAHDDPDPSCRSMAGAISNSFVQLTNGSEGTTKAILMD